MALKPWTPEQIPESFWQAIAAADGDRDQYLALLKKMNRTELCEFHVLYDRAANELTGPPHMDADASEDDVGDLANWIVAQGKDYYFDILAHPEKTPRTRTNDRGVGFFGAISRAYYELFGEEMDL
jgi:Protein of unknown function (DUF4240)